MLRIGGEIRGVPSRLSRRRRLVLRYVLEHLIDEINEGKRRQRIRAAELNSLEIGSTLEELVPRLLRCVPQELKEVDQIRRGAEHGTTLVAATKRCRAENVLIRFRLDRGLRHVRHGRKLWTVVGG